VEIIRGMAGITTRGRTLELEIGVTLGAGNTAMLTGQLEDGIIVIKAARLPSVCGMAGITLITKRAAMRIDLAVTGGAVHRRTFEELVSMALAASDRSMFTGQCEGGTAVVKRGGSPSAGCMA
jgi:hypothetical protein